MTRNPALLLPFIAIAIVLPAPAVADTGLTLFGRVSGKCFAANVGSGARDTHCFAPVFGGRHLRDTHRVVLDGKVIYRGETVYSVEAGTVTFTYFNSLGGVGHGNALAREDGIAFAGSMRADANAHPQSMDSRWRWTKDGYVMADGSGKPVEFRPVTAAAH